MSNPSIKELVADPGWYPYSFDSSYQHLNFIQTTATELRAAPFLDQRFLRPEIARMQVSVAEILPLTGEAPALPMIGHSAFCCSTLFARALDCEGVRLSLKEPELLISLAHAKRALAQQGRPPGDFARLYQMALWLLGRRFASGEGILLKPTNAANNVLEDALKAGSQVLFMFSTLEDFLISVLKKGEACKAFFRTQFNIFCMDATALGQIPPRQALGFTDLQIAALVWRHQLELFERLRRAFPQQVMVLQDKAFLADKEGTLGEAADFLGLAYEPSQLAEVAAGPVFNRHVKHADQTMSNEQRADEADIIRTQHGHALKEILTWATKMRLEGDILPEAQIS